MTLVCTIEIAVDGKIDPDDDRSVEEQVEEWVDGLVYWINDSAPGAVWAEHRGVVRWCRTPTSSS